MQPYFLPAKLVSDSMHDMTRPCFAAYLYNLTHTFMVTDMLTQAWGLWSVECSVKCTNASISKCTQDNPYLFLNILHEDSLGTALAASDQQARAALPVLHFHQNKGELALHLNSNRIQSLTQPRCATLCCTLPPAPQTHLDDQSCNYHE